MGRARARERNQLAKQVRIKGFRKGKVPPNIVEERYGDLIDQRAVSQLIETSYRQALSRHELQPIAEPEFGDVEYDPEKSLTFQVQVEIMPEVRLGRTGGFQIQRPDIAVPDEQVDEILAGIQKDHATLEPVDRQPEGGDEVSVRILQLDDEGGQADDEDQRPYRFELGAGYAIPDVEAAILTLSPGGTGEFDVQFPDDFDDREMAGSERRLRIELVDVKARRLPELDDELARSAGEFDSFSELEDAVRGDLARHHEREADRAVHEQLIDSIIEANPIEVPPALVSRYLDRIIEAPEDAPADEVEKARDTLGPAAERQIKRQLILERLIDENDLAATEEDLTSWLEEAAARQEASAADLRRQLAREKRLEALREQITMDKAFELLTSQSDIL